MVVGFNGKEGSHGVGTRGTVNAVENFHRVVRHKVELIAPQHTVGRVEGVYASDHIARLHGLYKRLQGVDVGVHPVYQVLQYGYTIFQRVDVVFIVGTRYIGYGHEHSHNRKDKEFISFHTNGFDVSLL